MQLTLIVGIALGAWLLILSFFTFYLYRFLNKLTKDVKEKELKKVLESILSTQKDNKDEIEKLTKEIERLEDEGFLHVQKVALVRFNPFEEIGGDHSFSLAVLDGKDTGFVITGLHTRERTRVYAKTINNGKSEVDLSEEEKKALTKAQKG